VWINRPQSDSSAVPPPAPTEPGAQAVSRMARSQAQRSLDTAEHLAIAERAVEQLSWTEAFDINFLPELSKNA